MQIRDERWTSAVFRILSKTISLEDIFAKINIQPTGYYKKGEHYSNRNPQSGIREANLWILKSNLGDQDTIESHIEYLISFLEENSNSINELQSECDFEIMCAYSSGNGQGGFTLNHEVLRKITEFPVDLSINLYPPSEKPDNL